MQLYIYKSDAAGTRGALITNDGTFGEVLVGAGLPAGFPENYVFRAEPGHYLVRVVYWDVPIPSNYAGSAQVESVNGKRRRISFYSRKVRNRRVVFEAATSTRRTNTLQVTVLGQRGSRKSKGRLVEIDGIGYRGR